MAWRENYPVNFAGRRLDPVDEYRDSGGGRRQRIFPDPQHACVASNKPLYGGTGVGGVAAPSSPWPIIICVAAVIILILIVVPVAIALSLLLPNSTGTTTSTATSTTSSTVSTTTQRAVTQGPQATILQVRCPDNIFQDTDQGQSSALIYWNLPTVLTPTVVGVPRFSSNVQPNTRFQIGAHEVRYTVTDDNNSRGSCLFTVTVTDMDDPVVICPNISLSVPTDPNQNTATVILPQVTATDNIMVVNISSNPGNHTAFALGPTLVIVTATDMAGNEATCNFTVTVIDKEVPIVTCPINYSVPTDPNQNTATFILPQVTATDNTMMVNIMSNPDNNTVFALGPTLVIVMATDMAGNEATCNFTVTVVDLEKPVLECPMNISNSTDAGVPTRNVTFEPIRLSDNDGSVPTLTSNYTSGSLFPIGSTQVTLIAKDTVNNTNTCTFTIRITDDEAPSLGSCPSNVRTFISEGSSTVAVTYTPSVPTANDNSGEAPSVVCHPSSGNDFSAGNQDVTCTATDDYGNSKSCTFRVTVIDTCQGNPCGSNGDCTIDGNAPSGFTCTCRNGYLGETCQFEP